MSELLAAAAQKLGAPEELVERSARARAEAQGVDVDTILSAWAGGEAAPAPAAAPTSAPEPEPSPEPEPADVAAPAAQPAGAPSAEPAVPAAAPAAAGGVAVLTRPEATPVVESRRQNAYILLAGIGAMLLFGALVSFIIPAIDRGDDRQVVAVPRLDSLAEDGRAVFAREGCWYCHTQQVRPVVADVGLGAVTEKGAESIVAPALTGIQRIGPDLSGFSRREGASIEAVAEFLRHPQESEPDSLQPSYGFLSDEDLLAVAAYVVADKADLPEEPAEDECPPADSGGEPAEEATAEPGDEMAEGTAEADAAPAGAPCPEPAEQPADGSGEEPAEDTGDAPADEGA